MGIRMDYNVVKLPDEYVTETTHIKYVVDPDFDPKFHPPGTRVPKVRVEEKVQEKGGWLFTFMRGHQIRCTSAEQVKLLGLSTTPRLIDDSTGLEVNEQGIPLDIADHIHAPLMDGGAPDTVNSLMARRGSRKDDPIADAIDDTE